MSVNSWLSCIFLRRWPPLLYISYKTPRSALNRRALLSPASGWSPVGEETFPHAVKNDNR